MYQHLCDTDWGDGSVVSACHLNVTTSVQSPEPTYKNACSCNPNLREAEPASQICVSPSSSPPGHQSLRQEGAKVVCRIQTSVNAMEAAFWNFSVAAQLYPKVRGIYRMGTVAGALPNLHLAAQSYHRAGRQYLIIWTTGQQELCQRST